MTDNRSFKQAVRAYADVHGLTYTTALRLLKAERSGKISDDSGTEDARASWGAEMQTVEVGDASEGGARAATSPNDDLIPQVIAREEVEAREATAERSSMSRGERSTRRSQPPRTSRFEGGPTPYEEFLRAMGLSTSPHEDGQGRQADAPRGTGRPQR